MSNEYGYEAQVIGAGNKFLTEAQIDYIADLRKIDTTKKPITLKITVESIEARIEERVRQIRNWHPDPCKRVYSAEDTEALFWRIKGLVKDREMVCRHEGVVFLNADWM